MKRALGVALLVALVLGAGARVARAEDVRPSFEGLEAGSDPLATYKLNTFGLVSHEITSSSWFVFGGKWWRVTRGKFRVSTSYDDFFRALGRADLAEQHARRRAVAGTLIWGGLLAEIGGSVLFITGLSHDGFGSRARVGLGLLVGGFTARAIGATVQHPAISEEEATQMMADYNHRLRIHLGLEDLSLAPAGARTLRGITLRGSW